ncbi:DNA helicase [Aggregatibacter actinomycetemcomitans serotype e str. SC936]|nr:DNA helicase [Aggregatibacter actinomycetemcomitans serotype e str. SC936]
MTQIKAKPVFSVEAEAAVLGSLILKNELFDEVSTLIHADDFFNYIHKIIFEGIVHLLQLGKPVDILTLEQYFTDKSLIDEFGFGYLAQIVNNTPSSSNIVAYAKVIARHSKQRRFAALGQFIVNEMQVSKDDEDLSVFEESVDKQYTNITVNQEKDNVANLRESFEKILTQMEQAAESADPVSGTPTGIEDLDKATTGGQPGELIIVAARPSMGKTAFAQLIAQSTLDKYTDAPIQFYSQEMPAEQLIQRFMSMRSRVSLQSIRQATELTEPEWAKVAETTGYIMKNWQDRLLIDDEPSLSPYRLHGTQDPITSHKTAHCLGRNNGQENVISIQAGTRLRRLTPTECERLMGFPDNYTQIPYRNKPALHCPDTPRYKALGNSMAVPVVRWIGQRLIRQLISHD